MRRSPFILLLSTLVFGCASLTPLARFERAARQDARPEEFAFPDSLTDVVNATISFRARGVRGKASGVIRRAAGGNLLVELYGRGELFMKVYYTPAQTVLWPASGMPSFFSKDDSPTLAEAVTPLLPKWRLTDVLPVPLGSLTSQGGITKDAWAIDKAKLLEHVVRPGCDGLVKTYDRQSERRSFPFRRVILASEDGAAKLKWSLGKSKRN